MDDLEYLDVTEESYEVSDKTEDEVEDIKCILLKDGTYIISKIVELVVDFGMPNCKLVDPKQITMHVSSEIPRLSSWPKYVEQGEVMISSENFLTICNPDAMLMEQYVKSFNY